MIKFGGLDPGAKGALALLGEDGGLEYVRFSKGWKEAYDWPRSLAHNTSNTYVLPELVGAMSSDGKDKAFQFGENTGLGLGVCYANHWQIQDAVRPNDWQIFFGLGGKFGPVGCTKSIETKHRKHAHQNKARQLFGVTFTLEECDAILIAVYNAVEIHKQIYGWDYKDLRTYNGPRTSFSAYQ